MGIAISFSMLWIGMQMTHAFLAAGLIVQWRHRSFRPCLILSAAAGVVPLVTLFCVVPNLASPAIALPVGRVIGWLMLGNGSSFVASVIAAVWALHPETTGKILACVGSGIMSAAMASIVSVLLALGGA